MELTTLPTEDEPLMEGHLKTMTVSESAKTLTNLFYFLLANGGAIERKHQVYSSLFDAHISLFNAYTFTFNLPSKWLGTVSE